MGGAKQGGRGRLQNGFRLVKGLVAGSIFSIAFVISSGGAVPAQTTNRNPAPVLSASWVGQVNALPVEYAADLLIPAIGNGLLDRSPGFRDKVLQQLFLRSVQAAQPTKRHPAASTKGSRGWGLVSAIDEQQLDSLSIQLRIIRIAKLKSPALGFRLAQQLTVPVTPSATCLAPVVPDFDGMYDTLLRLLSLNNILVRKPDSIGQLLDFMAATTTSYLPSPTDVSKASSVIEAQFNHLAPTPREYSTALLSSDLAGITNGFIARVPDPSVRARLAAAFDGFTLRSAKAGRCEDDFDKRGQDLVALRTAIAQSLISNSKYAHVAVPTEKSGPLSRLKSAANPPDNPLVSNLYTLLHAYTQQSSAQDKKRLMDGVDALQNSAFVEGGCRGCEFVRRLMVIEDVAAALRGEPEWRTTIGYILDTLTRSDLQKSDPGMWLFPLRRLIARACYGSMGETVSVARAEVARAVRASRNVILIEYFDAEVFLADRYGAILSQSDAQSGDNPDKALLSPLY